MASKVEDMSKTRSGHDVNFSGRVNFLRILYLVIIVVDNDMSSAHTSYKNKDDTNYEVSICDNRDPTCPTFSVNVIQGRDSRRREM
jgi:hypothetical protein